MVSDRIMLVGDAARQVKPTSGGGIHAALHAAGLAASVAGQSLRNGDLSASGLREYPRRWHASAGRELRRQHDMHRAFRHLTARDFRDLLTLLERRATHEAVKSASDMDYPSRLVRHFGLRHPRMTLRLLQWPRFPMAWL